MRALLAPVNVAGQPILLAQELRRRGVDVSFLEYSSRGGGHRFGYAQDRLVDFTDRNPMQVQVEVVKEVVTGGFDLVHFWMASFFTSPRYRRMRAMDLPFLKARGVKLVYRSTGFDFRQRRIQEERNPYNPYRYGYEPVFDDELQRAHMNLLEQYMDRIIVQDPEMHEYMPSACVIPRGLALDGWPHVGIRQPRRPLVVHAPSNGQLKGTTAVLDAVQALRNRGVKFDFKLIEGMSHREAMRWYAKADVIVDQLLIGWYGVLTVEALAMGKPVITYVRDDLFEQFTPAIPIENANPDTFEEKLLLLLSDADRRQDLAARGRAFVEEVHDIEKVADAVLDLYREVVDLPYRRPAGTADLDFFLTQFNSMNSGVAQLRKTIAQLNRDIRTLRAAETLAIPEEPVHQATHDDLFIAKGAADSIPASTSENAKDLRAAVRRRDAVAAEIERLQARLAGYDDLLQRRRELRVSINHMERTLKSEPATRALDDELFLASGPGASAEAGATSVSPAELAQLRAAGRRRERVAQEVAKLREQVADYDELIQRRRELRATANRRQRVLDEIDALSERIGDQEERLAAPRDTKRAAGPAPRSANG